MKQEHAISDEALESILGALGKHQVWIAYNTRCYFLNDSDIQLFSSEKEAEDWAFENNSEMKHIESSRFVRSLICTRK